MFERFSHSARQAVARARAEAVLAGDDHVGCEHLLVSLLAEPGAAAQALSAAGLGADQARAALARLAGRAGPDDDPLDAEALASIGIDLDTVRRAADASFGPGALDRAGRPGRGGGGGSRDGQGRLGGRLPFGADAKKALERGLRAAVQSRHPAISTGHLLIGVIDQGANPALGMLAATGIDPAALRADVVRRLAEAA
jgi:ATP-dependent Clp protease ATP-binding subunit ClpA